MLKEDILKLVEAQRRLEEHINKTHNITHTSEIFAKKVLSLQIEMGELALEFPSLFKYWSVNPKPMHIKISEKYKVAKNPNAAIEEFIDGLHFVLSIGNDLNYNDNLLYPLQTNRFDDPTMLLSNLLSRAFAFHYEPSKNYYQCFLEDYLNLGYMLGFTDSQIIEMYYEKNQINIIRQKTGY